MVCVLCVYCVSKDEIQKTEVEKKQKEYDSKILCKKEESLEVGGCLNKERKR